MLANQEIGYFLARWLVIIAICSAVLYTPFILRRWFPAAYKGFWQQAGELIGSFRKAVGLTIGQLIGLGIGTYLVYGVGNGAENSVGYGLLLLFFLVTFLAIVFGWRLYKLETKE